MARRPTVQELEAIATALTRQQLILKKQRALVESQMQHALEEVATAKAELQEAQDRLEEIDVYLEDVEDELHELQTKGDDEIAAQRKQEEFDELLDERDEELTLIEQLASVHTLRVAVTAHLRRMQVHVMRELTRAKQREQLLAAVALRSGMIKLTPRKL